MPYFWVRDIWSKLSVVISFHKIIAIKLFIIRRKWNVFSSQFMFSFFVDVCRLRFNQVVLKLWAVQKWYSVVGGTRVVVLNFLSADISTCFKHALYVQMIYTVSAPNKSSPNKKLLVHLLLRCPFEWKTILDGRLLENSLFAAPCFNILTFSVVIIKLQTYRIKMNIFAELINLVKTFIILRICCT